MQRTNHFFHRFFVVFILFFIQGALLYVYAQHATFIKNLKWEYITGVYGTLASYRLQDVSHYVFHTNEQTNVLAATTEETAKAIPVLLYHSILLKPDEANVLVPNFVDQMKTLHDAGYTTIGIDDFLDFMNGEKTLPEKSIMLSFDDGPKASYYPVDPVLQQFGFKAVAFIITRFSIGPGSKFYLSSDEIKTMLASGRWDIQLHTDLGHTLYKIGPSGQEGRFYPNKLWKEQEARLETDDEYKERIRSELFQGKQQLEHEYGITNKSFAFPFGDYGQNATNFPEGQQIIRDIVPEFFDAVFYQVYRGGGYTYNYPEEKSIMRKRIIVQPEWNGVDLLRALESGKPKDLPFQASRFTGSQGWANTWGSQSFSEEGMLLKTYDSEGGSVFLDGTYSWKNYSFLVDAVWEAGDSFSLLARYNDNDTFVACNMSDSLVSIIQSHHGEQTELARKDRELLLDEQRELHLGMEVVDNTVTCSENGTALIHTSDLDPSLSTGGIGFKNWAKVKDTSNILITHVDIQATK